MRSSLKGILRSFQPQVQFVRYKSKINITKPKPPHFDRHVVELVCVPYFSLDKKLPQYIPRIEDCESRLEKPKRQESPYATILAKDLLNWLNNSQLIAVFHLNTMDSEDTFEHKVVLKRAGFKLFTFEKEIVTKAITGTIYEPLLQFYQSHTAMALSKEPKLHELTQVVKQLPLMTLMAGVVNNRLLDYAQIQDYGSIKDIESARLTLTGVLTAASQNLVNQLNYHSNSLVQCLQQIKDRESGKG